MRRLGAAGANLRPFVLVEQHYVRHEQEKIGIKMELHNMHAADAWQIVKIWHMGGSRELAVL